MVQADACAGEDFIPHQWPAPSPCTLQKVFQSGLPVGSSEGRGCTWRQNRCYQNIVDIARVEVNCPFTYPRVVLEYVLDRDIQDFDVIVQLHDDIMQ